MNYQDIREDVYKIADTSKLFKIWNQEANTTEPLKLTWGQKCIYWTILKRFPKRNHVMTFTRYGKSHTVAIAVLMRAVTHAEKWAVVAPSTSKAMIIMRNVIDHCYDNEIFRSQLDMDELAKDKLKREVSKKRITFKGGGEIYVLSADNRNKAQAGDTLMGFGASNVIIDESSLIDDDIYSKIKRMLGDQQDNFLLEIGNPFHRNHFLRSSNNDNYNQITVDWRQGLKEGRVSQEFIDEMRDEANFGVLYDCLFPEEESVVDGWSLLFPEKMVKEAQRKENPNAYGEKRLGFDIGRGGDYSTWVLRTENFAELLVKTLTPNTMDAIGITRDIMDKYDLLEENVYMDATGLGSGVYDRFVESGVRVNGVNMAESALDKEKYINIRAEAYIRTSKWLKQGGTLKTSPDWIELCDMRYQLRSSGKIQMISKERLLKNGIHSPDVADALMLTFASPDDTFSYRNKQRVKQNRSKQPTYD